ncbi:MAG: ribonuclease P protein component [Flavobacteriales bacterium]|jgi:ribonuclease P protein component|nr:ribonuclease P protein component [Flavobacteriales bacterium]MDG1916551.1 ribonuclease P protein component [Flavobacteriales bacterium]|tara:strand:+ start:137 stop:514 length:378 start_codon:yes stop_codon:yes gene_type:complete
MASHRFSKVDRLCSSRRIESLFLEGERFYEFPFKAIWHEDNTLDTPLRVAISVPKKRLPKASQRNHVKRLIREAYRTQKSTLLNSLEQNNKTINLMLVYTLPSILSFAEIEDKISVTLQRLADEV